MKHFNLREKISKQFVMKALLNIFYLKDIERRTRFILDALRDNDNS